MVNAAAADTGIDALQTPALLLDLAKVRANAARMSARARSLGVSLRPHLKTAKSAPVARILTEGWSGAIMVSTLAEAEYFFSEGFSDILYGVGVTPSKFERIAGLATRGRFGVLVDSLETAKALVDYSSSSPLRLDVHIEIDADGHRGGVAPQSQLLLDIGARLTQARDLTLRGVLTHAGEAYNARGTTALERCAAGERDAVVNAAVRLTKAGHQCESVSLGSTPTAMFARDLSGVTELRAGVFAFGDLVQAELGACAIEDIALGVLTTVIGHQPGAGRVIVDAGWLALSGDRGTADFPHDWHYGAVADPLGRQVQVDVTVKRANQEHGLIEAREGILDVSRFPLGSRVRILPNHACATAAAFDTYAVHDGNEVVAFWPRKNGW
jgi:D-serine deaminase-like pyridoxal phosphate-dependent protein